MSAYISSDINIRNINRKNLESCSNIKALL